MTPPSTRGSEQVNRRAKRRRTQNNFSDEWAAMVSSTLFKEGFTSELYRVGAPPLQLLPLTTTEVQASVPEKVEFGRLRPRIELALINRDID